MSLGRLTVGVQHLEVVLQFAARRRTGVEGLLGAGALVSTGALEQVEAVLRQRQDRRALAVDDRREGVDEPGLAEPLDVALGGRGPTVQARAGPPR